MIVCPICHPPEPNEGDVKRLVSDTRRALLSMFFSDFINQICYGARPFGTGGTALSFVQQYYADQWIDNIGSPPKDKMGIEEKGHPAATSAQCNRKRSLTSIRSKDDFDVCRS